MGILFKKKITSLAAGVVLALGVSGPASAQTQVTLHLDWLINGFYAPFFTALERGWYKEAGLDVKIVPGKGSFDSIRSVGAANAEFESVRSSV